MSLATHYTDASSLAEAIAQQCQQAHQTADGWEACCPAHPDTTASFSITPAQDKVLLHCFAGCTLDALVAALGLTVADLFLRHSTNGHRRIVQVYDYRDATGYVLHQTVRYDPKKFQQRRPDPAHPGEFIWSLKGIQPILYHLSEVVAAVQCGEVIYLTEGEKDSDALQALGLVATCNAMGAGKWRDAYTETLRGAWCVILPDNDDAGRKHAEQVARSLDGIAAGVKVLALPTLPDKGDVSDWLQAGGTRVELDALVLATPAWTPPTPPAVSLPPSGPGGALPWSDYVNALHLVDEHGATLRYCYPWRSWLVWTGTHWQRDSSGMVMRAAKETIKRLAQRVPTLDDAEAAALLRHVKQSLATSKLKAMIENAQSEPGIAAQPQALDTNPWLLNCANETLDLQTGQLRPHAQGDLLTRCLSIPYDPDARCPTWDAFLWRIMGGTVEPDDPDLSVAELAARQASDDRAQRLVTFLQRAIGYSLTGTTHEQCLFMLHGSGANGKSTLLELLQALLGDYAQSTPSASLLAKDRHEGIPNDIARLRGARLVTAVEIGQGKRLNEELVKRLTGQDTLTARFLHAEFFDFKAEFKLCIACNHLPQIRGTDYAIWRRVRLIPFLVTIPEAQQDPALPAKLLAERPGILRWAVQGCLDWQEDGLGTPQEVTAATSGYRASMDVIGRFLEENCLVSPNVQVKAGELYAAFKKWCEASGEYVITLKAFGTDLDERGFAKHVSNGVWRLGIGLL